MKNNKIVWNQFLSFHPIYGVSVMWQVVIVVGLFLLQSYVGWWMIVEDLSYAGMPVEWTGILAPIYEEILFRGVILALLVSAIGTTKGIMFSALLFGLWHFKNIIYFGPSLELWWQVLYTFVLGLLLAWLTIKTQSIWLSVVLHYFNNISAPISWVIFSLI